MTSYVRPQRAEVRTAVLAAAGDLFLRQGYRATTLDAIAAAAGFTKGAVYSNFGGKPQLFAAAVTATFVERSTTAISAVATLRGEPADIARQLTAVVGRATWSPVLSEFRAAAREDERVATIYAELRGSYRDRLAEQLRGLAGTLGLPDDYDYEAAAVLIITVINGLAEERATTPGALPDDRIEMIMSRLVGGLLP